MKKSDYTRSTIECDFAEVKPKFTADLKKYAEINNLGEIEKEGRFCFETTNSKKGFLGRIKTNYTVICITKRFLFWAIIDDKKDSGMAAAQWSDISEIWDWEETEMGKLYQDQGVELFGFIYLWSKRSRWFIGIDKSEAGQKCRAIMKKLIEK